MVAAYFYRSDNTPFAARDAQSPYASKSGQLYGTYTFQIDSDSQPFDGVMDIPLTEFSDFNSLQFRCIVYSDNQSAAQTDLISVPNSLFHSGQGSGAGGYSGAQGGVKINP